MTALLDELFPLTETATAWPQELPGHLSASQISLFQRCAEQYRRRYLLGEKERPGAALVWGIADHQAHEYNFRQKIDSHEDVPVDDVQAMFAAAFDDAVDERGGHDEVQWGDDKPGDLKDAGINLVAAYHRQVSPLVQPTSVEREFTLEVAGVPVPVIGRMDVETAGPAIERKTAKSKPPNGEPKPEWRIQGLLYQEVAGRQVDWHVSVKSKTPAVWTPLEASGLSLPVVASRADAAARLVLSTARSILAYMQMFGPDEPWPGALTHPWACSWCGFRPTCSWWGNS